MTTIEKYFILALALLLALSLGANYIVTREYLSQRDKTEQATNDFHTADEAAKQCSAGVDGLVTQANQRASDAAAARDFAQKAATAAQTRANTILKTAPKFAGDDCKSGQAQMDDWLASRAPAVGAKP